MRTVDIAVIGGGITGRLINIVMPETVVYDWMPEPRTMQPLTRNYGANYLWHPLQGIPCREFPVITHIDGVMPTFHKVCAYKDKIGKSGDVVGWERQFQATMTGYDFLELPHVDVQYDHRIVKIDRGSHVLYFARQDDVRYRVLISTIPLYSLLSLMHLPEPAGGLRYKPIYFKVTPRPPDAPFPPETMYVNYISDPLIGPYRFCDRGRERHYESIVPYDGPSTKRIMPGKIYENTLVPETLALLEAHDIFTFGRYGSWSPDELVHETFARIKEWKTEYEDFGEVK